LKTSLYVDLHLPMDLKPHEINKMICLTFGKQMQPSKV